MSVLLCSKVGAQNDTYMSDTISIEPIVPARLHGAREATEEEKEYARMLAQEREEQRQIDMNLPAVSENGQIGRASCRERVYVLV